MPLPDLTGNKYIDSLDPTYPTDGDNIAEGDDLLRGIQNVLQKSFPNITGAANPTQTELNYLVGQNQELATTDSPTFATITFGSLADGAITVTAWVDEDDMASDSATLIPTQQSVKAYVDSPTNSQAWTLKQTADSPVTAAADDYLVADPNAGALTINLPAGAAGTVIRVKVSDNADGTNYVRLAPNGSEVIAGQAGGTALDVDKPFYEGTLVYDTTLGWVI